MTPLQITKALETANKNLEKALKNVSMYISRRDKSIQDANKKGFNISLDDFQEKVEEISVNKKGDVVKKRSIERRGEMPFDISYKVISNWEKSIENEDLADKERKKIEHLQTELSNLTQKNDSNTSIIEKLEKSMVEFKKQWFDKMETWHRNYYNHIQEILPQIKRRNERCKTIIDRMRNQYGFKYHTSNQIKKLNHGLIYINIQDVIQQTSAILQEPVSKYDLATYMDMVDEELRESWKHSMEVLNEKLQSFNVNVDEIKIKGIGVTPKGFECLITDGKARTIHTRMIWAGENSLYVCPHTRYIVTERKS